MSAPLNLARHPLRNERLPTLLLGGACLLLLALSARHAVVASELRRGGARDVAGEVGKLDREIERLRDEAAGLQRTPPARETLEEWTALKELVDRRAFSWTSLFAQLEKVLPPTVRLSSIAPTSSEGPLELSLVATGRSAEDAIALMKALQGSPGFDGAFLDAVGESSDGVAISCTVRYGGARRPSPTGGGS